MSLNCFPLLWNSTLENYPLAKYNFDWQVLHYKIIAEISGKENCVIRVGPQYLLPKAKIWWSQISKTAHQVFLILKEKLDHGYVLPSLKISLLQSCFLCDCKLTFRGLLFIQFATFPEPWVRGKHSRKQSSRVNKSQISTRPLMPAPQFLP